MVSLRSVAGLAASLAVVSAQSSGRPGHGMIGHGIPMYEPECAHACRGGSPRAHIDCGNGEEHAAGHHGGVVVTPACMAANEPWLKTVAYCIYQKCQGIDNSTLEFYWQTELISRKDFPQAKWSYQESLHHVFEEGVPTEVLPDDSVLNRTVLVDEETYIATANGNTGFGNTEKWHVNFNLIILLTGAGIPILCSLLRFLPFPKSFVSTFNAYLIDPPVFGSHHNVPILKNLAIVPTRGQFLFLLYIFAINIIGSFVALDRRTPNSWWGSPEEEFLSLYSNRVGMLSFANLPLLFLYAGRNNILLWITNWSHSTFLLLHRWIAFICMLEAVLHSAVYLDLHVRIYEDHEEIASVEYWYWGIIATLALVLIIPFSILPLRQRLYEVFHALHIVLALVTIVGCWYHIIWRYQRQWGYEVWVLITIGVWVFDWFIRAVRIGRNGVLRAYVTKIDEDYLRVDIPGLDSHGHVYLYFPTLNWRVWESHPFSVIGHSSLASGPGSSGVDEAIAKASEKLSPDVNETGVGATSSSASSRGSVHHHHGPVGTTLYIRLRTGTTVPIAKMAGVAGGVAVLAESSYGGESKLYPDGGHPEPSAAYPNLIAIAGGVGITAVLPVLSSAQSLYAPLGSKKLFWGVRASSQGLVNSVQSIVAASGAASERLAPAFGRNLTTWGDVNVEISIGERFDLRAVLEAELAGENSKAGTTVLVCGPGAMADEVRNVVTALGRQGHVIRYVEEAFAW
ncbi:ferric reductase transmembrane component 4 [Plectosphaerella cucumerina]|uniref:Ferric reductase transmembrane component 4 n=1 Tax=Plectosphaerella cucumerina TaxID=40658 RepID=A0A8K0TJ18_9PEZI|nr:ferric reductase transmembrane component 4 [Plectosphaerella cucumerina]